MHFFIVIYTFYNLLHFTYMDLPLIDLPLSCGLGRHFGELLIPQTHPVPNHFYVKYG